MGKTTKTFTVSWTPRGDPRRILGWNVVLNGSSTDPYASPLYHQVYVPAPAGDDYSWVGQARNVQVSHVIVDGGTTVYAWVQQVYRDSDSTWISSTGASAADDGLATADEIGESASRKWAGESGADKTQTALDSGVVTAGRVEVSDDAGTTVKAGLTGGGAGDTEVRIWAGSTYANRATAPFRVTQGGTAYMEDGYVGGVPVATVADVTSTTTAPISWTIGTGGDHATLADALAALPSILNHDVDLYMADETHIMYALISGFSGTGTLTIRATTYQTPVIKPSSVQALVIRDNTVNIHVRDLVFEANANNRNCVSINRNPGLITISGCLFGKTAGTVSTTGIYVANAFAVYISSCYDGTTPVDTGLNLTSCIVVRSASSFGSTEYDHNSGILWDSDLGVVGEGSLSGLHGYSGSGYAAYLTGVVGTSKGHLRCDPLYNLSGSYPSHTAAEGTIVVVDDSSGPGAKVYVNKDGGGGTGSWGYLGPN